MTKIKFNCSRIEFNLYDDYFSLRYDAGMSLEKRNDCYKAELIMTAFFACRNVKKHLLVGEEFCELGIATINFASEYCELITVSNGLKGVFHFKEGAKTSSKVEAIDSLAEYTEIILKPDQQIFNDLKFSYEGVKLKVEELSAKLGDVEIILSNKS